MLATIPGLSAQLKFSLYIANIIMKLISRKDTKRYYLLIKIIYLKKSF